MLPSWPREYSQTGAVLVHVLVHAYLSWQICVYEYVYEYESLPSELGTNPNDGISKFKGPVANQRWILTEPLS
jgi:hypothetical protein